MTPTFPKARIYVEAIEEFVRKTVSKNENLTELYDTCTGPSTFTKKNDYDSEIQYVRRRESELEDYRREVMAFIDGSKQWLIRECFLVDYDAENFVSKTPEEHRHHLNTHILEKGNEMHPLAVRYFLYDVNNWIKSKLYDKDGLRENNKSLKEEIENYKDAFDIPETKEKKETAADTLTIAKQRGGGLMNKATGWFSGQDPYKTAKENYETRSRQQAENIQSYAVSKLLEEVYAGLVSHINRLIEESENFFENLPTALQSLDNERIALLTKHNPGNADKSIEYVLASEEQKKDIYKFIISRNDSPFFPTKMSASVYYTMFRNVCRELNASGFATSKKKDKKVRKAEAIEANKSIVKECIIYQDEIIRESNSNYVNMNVLEALREESMRECDNDNNKAWEYMKEKFNHFKNRAEIFGPNNLDDEIRYINAWGMNPDCVNIATIEQEKADVLFGDTDVQTNPKTAATRLMSDYFSKNEIIRANAVTLLAIDKYFKKFLARERTEYTEESYGNYYIAYQDVISKMLQPDSKTFTPHLDKYWHLPSYMPNIGSSMAFEKKKLFRALYGGFLFDKFKAVYYGGEYYWKFFSSKTFQYIKNIEGRRITIGQSQEAALNSLFEKGLVNNPGIVDHINDYVEEQWAEAKEEWLCAERDENNELQKMKDSNIVKKIIDFQFNIHNSFKKSQSWFTILNSRKGLLLFDVINEHKDFFFEDLIEHLIEIFGSSSNTKKLCKYVLSKAGAKMQDDINILLERFEDEGRFEPKDE
jgi:hypothetical protein